MQSLKELPQALWAYPVSGLQNGSGWGYVEAVRRAECGKSPLCSKITFGRESITEEEKPWLELVENGAFCEPQDPKKSGFMIQKDYIPLLEKAIAQRQLVCAYAFRAVPFRKRREGKSA